MYTNTGRPILASLLPLVSNPTALAALGLGAAGWVIYSLVKGDDEVEGKNGGFEGNSDGSAPLDEPSEPSYQAAATTVPGRPETVDESYTQAMGSNHAAEPVSGRYEDEMEKKELIRQAMSELGKRSAAARAKKKRDGN